MRITDTYSDDLLKQTENTRCTAVNVIMFPVVYALLMITITLHLLVLMPLDFGKGLHEDSCYRTKSNLKRDFSTWCQGNVRKLSFLRLESLCAAQEIIPETAIIIHAFRAMWS